MPIPIANMPAPVTGHQTGWGKGGPTCSVVCDKRDDASADTDIESAAHSGRFRHGGCTPS